MQFRQPHLRIEAVVVLNILHSSFCTARRGCSATGSHLRARPVTSRDQMLHGAQKKRALELSCWHCSLPQQPVIPQQLQPLATDFPQARADAGLQRSRQIIEIVDPPGAGLEVLRRLRCVPDGCERRSILHRNPAALPSRADSGLYGSARRGLPTSRSPAT